MSEKLVLIDGHSIAHRAFYGVPDLTNSAGLHTNAIYGFLNILFRILDEERPDYLVVTFDEHAPTFRHSIFSEYKGTRKPMPDEMRQQMPVLRELLEAMEITCVSLPGLEADDLMGTLAKKSQAQGMEVTLVSGDRDLLQISDEHILIRIPKTNFGKTTIEDYRPQDVLEKYQVTPAQFIELKALMGDTADNIPGVPKIGEKTATELMVSYGSIKGIYEHLDDISKKSIRESLRDNKDLADLSLTLATIKIDCDVELDKEKSKAEGFFTEKAYEIVKKLEFKKLLEKFNPSISSKEKLSMPEIYECADVSEFIDCLKAAITSDIGIDLLCDNDCLYGASVAYKDGEVVKRIYYRDYMPLGILENGIKELVSCSNSKIYLSNIKQQYDYLELSTVKNYFDIIIGAYLINPLKSDYDFDSIALEYLSLSLNSTKDRFGKISLSEASMTMPEVVKELCADRAFVALTAGSIIDAKLEDYGMSKIMNDIEMPLSAVLYKMEKEGILVRRKLLEEYSKKLSESISLLEKKILEIADSYGVTGFNVNSPKQLGELLFEKMGIPGGKKTKTGYSTAADVLEKLAADYPFVKDILEYRGLTKLKSTYADGLVAFIGEDMRIHTSFNQTITATGRISSTDPNLQNIPIRTELGRELRKVFVAKEGCVLVDADYSQIELRVLASMSGDEGLIDAYKENKDIHRITASKVFGVPFDDVTDQQRRNAKAVNFGVVYGISSFGLSQDLSISRKEASEYIEQYFKTYPKIKQYLDDLIESAKNKGYSETYYGRRRPIPELSSSNFMQRSFGERVAMNAPIQGTAADIIKIAMLNVDRALQDNGLKSKLILQVHDELVIETYQDEVDVVCKILESSMKQASDLAVSLEVGMEVGNNWFEAH